MFAVVQNGEIRQIIQPDVAFTIGEKQYSARFIRNATEAERKAVGVYEIIYGEQKDQRFYWVTGPSYRVNEVDQTVEATFTNTPKALEDKLETKEDGTPLFVQVYDPATDSMVDTTEQVVTKGLKSQFIAQTKATAGSLLAATDWKVVRAAEGVKPVDADTTAARAAIRAYSDSLEAAITGAADVEALIAVLNNQAWPK
jgi:hypothetical protein